MVSVAITVRSHLGSRRRGKFLTRIFCQCFHLLNPVKRNANPIEFAADSLAVTEWNGPEALIPPSPLHSFQDRADNPTNDSAFGGIPSLVRQVVVDGMSQ